MVVPPEVDTKNLYFYEQDRIDSFKSWPFGGKQICNPIRMAEAGFYWCGTEQENDTAACFLCRKVLDGWESSDDPWKEHKKHAPQCPFVKLAKPEREQTVAERFDLLEVFVEKLKEDGTEKVTKAVTDKANELREKFKLA